MNSNDISHFLHERGVKPTPNRILVLRELMHAASPVSLADLEASLGSIDKASIFRVIELFADKELIHVIEDGSRSLKYELCHGADRHSAADQHVHFYCEKCRSLFCFDHIVVPRVDIPDSFSVKSVNYMLKGICPKCAGVE